jgi:hypothetical protein
LLSWLDASNPEEMTIVLRRGRRLAVGAGMQATPPAGTGRMWPIFRRDSSWFFATKKPLSLRRFEIR